MQIMPCATSTDTTQQRGSSSIRTGVCSAWAAWTQVVRDDGEDSSTAGRQGQGRKTREDIRCERSK